MHTGLQRVNTDCDHCTHKIDRSPRDNMEENFSSITVYSHRYVLHLQFPAWNGNFISILARVSVATRVSRVKDTFRVENGGYSSRNTCRTHLRKTDGPQTLGTGEGWTGTQAKLEREERVGTDLAAVEHVRWLVQLPR